VVEATKVDGRRARGLKTRDAIVTALMDLVAAGDISPTAQRVANRAGVSVRSVYQHFTDVEGLFSQASAQLHDWVSQVVVDINVTLPLNDRVGAFVAARSEMLEALTPFSRAARALESSSESLRQSRMALLKEGRERLSQVFEPELSRLNAPTLDDVLAVLDMITSWPAWDHLRSTGASTEAARRAMSQGIQAVLAGPAQKS
jgi:TetR/AcrR family transcriptional regulator of autoinduction and epiphytic fitness